jgi:hypothetical protein
MSLRTELLHLNLAVCMGEFGTESALLHFVRRMSAFWRTIEADD